MKRILFLLFCLSVSLCAYPQKNKKDPNEKLIGTWKIRNVQKIIGKIRIKKYEKDNGDPKAYIKRLKNSTVFIYEDGSASIKAPNGKEYNGTWRFKRASKHIVGHNNPATQHQQYATKENWLKNSPNHGSHMTDYTEIIFTFTEPVGSRRYNMSGAFSGVKKKGTLFYCTDDKYMFTFRKELNAE